MQPRIYGPYKHRDRWRVHIVISDRGKRTTRRKSFATWEQANAYVSAGRDEAQGTTVKTAVDALLEEMRAAGQGSGTIITNTYRLRHFFNLPTNDLRPIRWLANRGADLYAAAQIERKADTHQAELGLAKLLGDLCVRKRWLRVNPFADVEPVGRKTHGSTKPRLRVDESRKLRKWCLEHAGEPRAVITLAYLLLGARASELVKRSVRDLDDDGRLLWIERTKTIAGTRHLELPDELREMLLVIAAARPADAPLFADEDGERADRHWAYRRVREVCKEAGVPVLSPQALRRTQSDMATDAGVSAIEVARHLGHESSAITDRSYRDRQVTQNAKADRAFRVIAGGMK